LEAHQAFSRGISGDWMHFTASGSPEHNVPWRAPQVVTWPVSLAIWIY